MKLGFFTMPIHPLEKDWRQSLQEDREAFLLADELGGETRKAIMNFEGDSGLGGGKGMHDAGVWIESAQLVQNGLVRNLSR